MADPKRRSVVTTRRRPAGAVVPARRGQSLSVAGGAAARAVQEQPAPDADVDAGGRGGLDGATHSMYFVLTQCLWRLQHFRERFVGVNDQETGRRRWEHVHAGPRCVFCALKVRAARQPRLRRVASAASAASR